MNYHLQILGVDSSIVLELVSDSSIIFAAGEMDGIVDIVVGKEPFRLYLGKQSIEDSTGREWQPQMKVYREIRS